MEILIFTIFVLTLMACIIFHISIIIALLAGFILFFGYGIKKGFSFKQMGTMIWGGVKTVHNILIAMLLIGMLTALWRAAGTVPVIICYGSWMIRPSVFLLASFLLNSLVSFLTGTSFGTAATMGVICMTMATTMGVNPVWAGGSVLSGIFFGDRCSPVSTSALLVCELTKTDIYKNIKNMCLYAILPFTLSCIVYLLVGVIGKHGSGSVNVWKLFSKGFILNLAVLLPAVVIVVLSIFRVNVKTTIASSIVMAIIVCIWIQNIPLSEIIKTMVFGYHAVDSDIAAMLDGGGMISMMKVIVIVFITSTYSGIFEGTHMLDEIRTHVAKLGIHVPAFLIILLIAIVTAMISCNQSLAIMLTLQLCETLEPDKEKMALALEDGPVIIPPLIPWSIAGAIPIATIGAPSICLIAACYLYLIPIGHLMLDSINFKRRGIK